MMPRWIHASFCAIWLVTAFVFFVLGADAMGSANTMLSRFEAVPAPATGSVRPIWDDRQAQFNSISSGMNTNIDKLEDSIRHASRLAFWLDLLSFFAALMGFFTQASAYVYETRHSNRPKADGADLDREAGRSER